MDLKTIDKTKAGLVALAFLGVIMIKLFVYYDYGLLAGFLLVIIAAIGLYRHKKKLETQAEVKNVSKD